MFKQPRRFWCVSALLTIVCVGYIPAKLAQAKQQAPEPQLILFLGGGADRERSSVPTIQAHSQLAVWVSTGSPQAATIFESADIAPMRLHWDCRATDTVTNFTTVIKDLRKRDIRHVYVLTSDFHMPRAMAIATIVLGSQGIAFTPMVVPSHRPPESNLRILRDIGRSFVWLATGRTGASLKQHWACQDQE
ncbi:YdcF family protein [Phormidesmis sp. 146-33]